MKKIIQAQFFVLLIGTVFAWTNFTNELFAWLNNEACTTGCSAGGEVINPFYTACFYGALFFSIAFVFSIMLLVGSRALKSKEEKGEQENKDETRQEKPESQKEDLDQ